MPHFSPTKAHHGPLRRPLDRHFGRLKYKHTCLYYSTTPLKVKGTSGQQTGPDVVLSGDRTPHEGGPQRPLYPQLCIALPQEQPLTLSRPEYKALSPPTLLQHLSLYKDLSKAKLSALVVFTTFSGYILSPHITYDMVLSVASLKILLPTFVGTSLCSFSANAFNQWIEIPFDSQMNRTKGRVLPRHALSPPHAFTFACICGGLGTGILAWSVSSTTAALALGTIALYAGVYTPFKRWSIFNTWIGAVVGAMPPLIGWSAATAYSHLLAATDASSDALFLGLEPGAWVLAGLLYAWQFPHFNSLSWNLRKDYSKAGYRMSSVLSPQFNALVSLRYTLALFPLTCAAYYFHMTDGYFVITGNLVNMGLLHYAARFYYHRDAKTARRCFFASLFHLPLLLVLLFIHKHRASASKDRLDPS